MQMIYEKQGSHIKEKKLNQFSHLKGFWNHHIIPSVLVH